MSLTKLKNYYYLDPVSMKSSSGYCLDTEHKLNVHKRLEDSTNVYKAFRRCPRRLMNVLFTLMLRSVFRKYRLQR